LLLAAMGRLEEAVAETRQTIGILETSGPRQQPRLAVVKTPQFSDGSPAPTQAS